MNLRLQGLDLAREIKRATGAGEVKWKHPDNIPFLSGDLYGYMSHYQRLHATYTIGIYDIYYEEFGYCSTCGQQHWHKSVILSGSLAKKVYNFAANDF
jgi:hypothetical protein